MSLTILKIGGSCLTYKKENLPEIRKGFLANFAKEVSSAQKKKPFPLLIVHGGGSITHPLLDKFKIADKCKAGKISDPKDKLSAAKIHLAMNILNKEVVKALQEVGLPAWPIQTSALFSSSGRKLNSVAISSIRTAIKKKFIPVLHGDFILDDNSSISICSGDLVSSFLAKKLGAKKLLFASDINGVYENFGEKKKQVLIKNLDFPHLSLKKSDKRRDHSGDMPAKLDYIRKYGKNIDVMIFNGLTRDNFKKAFSGSHVGTKIKL